jgi:2,4-dienoyl-CoA reductase-like NADH-dependent reductase (Old Yellow Enzyme family)
MQLQHRFAMAPMTRSRANADGTPSQLAPVYYRQRASLGLLISEGTQPSEDGQGYLNTPGIFTHAHMMGWRKVTEAVHAANAHLFIQLMHVGRIAHPDNTSHHRQPVAPSAIPPGEAMFTAQGQLPIPVPHALSARQVKATVQDFRTAAARAMEAGADGVEIHGANGYLIQQFLSRNSNIRSDEYGGSVENRARFAIEVCEAVAAEVGAKRTGIRLSPGSRLGGIDEGPSGQDTYIYLVAEVAKLDLAYLHLAHPSDDALTRELRWIWPNAFLLNRANRTLQTAASDIEMDLADVIPVGRWALSNPDFVERVRRGAPLNSPDEATFYGGGARGYVDYPALSIGIDTGG